MQRALKYFCALMVGVIGILTEVSADPNELVQQAKGLRDPLEKQRKLQLALDEDPLHAEALILLGESWYRDTGDIRRAVTIFRKLIELGKDETGYASGYLEEIGILFKPLQITLIDRRVSSLGYIEGLKFRFRAPRSLQNHQRKRLKYLEAHATEFQLNGIDQDGRPFFELAYFPVVIDLGDRYSNYALVIGEERRYRFDFTEEVQDPVEIRWEDGWKLIERTPAELVKVEYPSQYKFEPAQDVAHFALVDSVNQAEGRYIAADANTVLVMSESKEESDERRYNLILKIALGIAAVVGLIGTR